MLSTLKINSLQTLNSTSILILMLYKYMHGCIYKYIFKNARFNAFNKIYESHTVPIIDYSAGIGGY